MGKELSPIELVILGLGLLGLGLLAGVLSGIMGSNDKLDREWAEHATEQCYPYALYHSKADDFSWMCAKVLLDSSSRTR